MRYQSTKGLPWKPEDMAFETQKLIVPHARKFAWFLGHGYEPHLWQILFHTMSSPVSRVMRNRHLVAGRRGGKTLSAAEEVVYYAAHPDAWWMDAQGIVSDEPLWIWALAKDHKMGRPSLLTFIKVLRKSGLQHGKDYTYNKTEKIFEFANGTLVEFKSADDPESLRGAGLHILWIDEAAIIRDGQAYGVVSPSLADHSGWVITTTTPKGKNWFYEEFWNDTMLQDPENGSVEYRSIDNPYFQKKEWERYKRMFHPLMFKQEFLAMFDAMTGVELSGDWLRYYTLGDLPLRAHRTVPKPENLDLKVFMGVDPAISLSENADHFAMAVVGVARDNSQVYLLDTYMGRLPFPEQVEKVTEWYNKWRPDIIGIEAQVYQRALIQQLERNQLSLPIIPIMNATRKLERIMGMSTSFKIGKVKIHAKQNDFIDQWLNYDPAVKNPKDDLLDAVEMALRTAGVLAPRMRDQVHPLLDPDKQGFSFEELAQKELLGITVKGVVNDPMMGEDW